MNSKQHQIDTDSCLIPSCENSRSKRGLCAKHYEQYRRKLDSLAEDERSAWELRMVGVGKLLPAKQGNRSVDNAFDEEFEAFKKELDKLESKQATKEAATKPTKTTKKKQA